jgi:bla regulator protein blaR1
VTLLPAWMLWAVALTLVLALAGAGAERALRPLGFPVRWGWLSMTLLAGGLLLAAWLPGKGEAAGGRVLLPPPGVTPDGAAAVGGAGAILPGIPFQPMSLVAEGALRLTEGLPSWSGTAVAVLWALASLAMASVLISGHLRLHRHRRRWERARVQGRPVLLSPAMGPAVVGIRNPQIVIPRGLLELPDPEMQLILLHEESHAASRDTLILAAGLVPAVLFPWNPALWWMLSRLRRGVELDCDRRILRTGVPPARYARLLLTVATRGSGAPEGRRKRLPIPALASPALVESTSLLERRIRNMKTHTKPTGRASGLITRTSSLAAGLVALALVVVACESEPPTVVDLGPPSLVGAPGLVDAPGLEDGGAAAGQEVGAQRRVGEILIDPRPSALAQAGPQPLIFVDGVRTDPAFQGGLAEFSPEAIERIEVLKGSAAQALFGPEASGGVIQIFMKEEHRMDPP